MIGPRQEVKMNIDRRLTAIIGVTLLAVAAALIADPIPQDPTYHDFADQRTMLRIPNFSDVLSNGAFLIVGSVGILFLVFRRNREQAFEHFSESYAMVVLFAGVFLTGLGSGWYHLRPSNESLVWDRLAMTIAFMGVFSSVISERIHRRAGEALLVPLVMLGLFSVLWWALTEGRGHGDLRPYAMVQLYPMVLIPLILLLFPSRYTRGRDYWLVLLWYVGAKVLDCKDDAVFDMSGFVSGHTLKHLFAAGASLQVLHMLKNRGLRKGK